MIGGRDRRLQIHVFSNARATKSESKSPPTTTAAEKGRKGKLAPRKYHGQKRREGKRGIGGEFARNYDFPETEQSEEKWGAERERTERRMNRG